MFSLSEAVLGISSWNGLKCNRRICFNSLFIIESVPLVWNFQLGTLKSRKGICRNSIVAGKAVGYRVLLRIINNLRQPQVILAQYYPIL